MSAFVPYPSAPEIRPLRRSEYDQLVQLGAFEDEKVELLFGAIVSMSPQRLPHSSTVHILTQLLIRRLGDRADVRVQLPFAAADESEPEPDFAVVSPGHYRDALPEQAQLIVEVAETSLKRDRKIKAALYARSGIPEYWVVNLVDNVIEVFTEPDEGQYRQIRTYSPGEGIRLVAFEDEVIAVAALLR